MTSLRKTHLVTGAFGYSGRFIAERLLADGRRVRTLTAHPKGDDPLASEIEIAPFDFDDASALRQSLADVEVVYNTYWVRFDRGGASHQRAVADTLTLIRAAVEAGVKRVVHVSITNPSEASPLPYFRGKAVLERALLRSGLSHAILRPAVFFGGRDVLLNNIAWLLRRLPVFGVPGRGDYRVQPVHVDDLARIAVELGSSRENRLLDAVGPDVFRFEELVRLIARSIGSRSRIVHVSPWLFLQASRLLGLLVRDVLVTRHELDGLMADLLVSDHPPTGKVRLGDWLAGNADELGRDYASELARHYRGHRRE